MSYIIACSKVWDPQIANNLQIRLGDSFTLISDPKELNLENLKIINPKKIFFPHWSHILKKELYENFECIMFHMTDLPFGRGGSPLQNLIARGHSETKISSFICDGGIDTGPILLKKNLSLEGNAHNIFLRATKIISEMIEEIIRNNPLPIPQSGDSVEFKRRTPKDGNLLHAQDLKQINNYIRMLDAPDYPHAFLELDSFIVHFTNAVYEDGTVKAQATFLPKGN